VSRFMTDERGFHVAPATIRRAVSTRTLDEIVSALTAIADEPRPVEPVAA
jgi:hypothetical protein